MVVKTSTFVYVSRHLRDHFKIDGRDAIFATYVLPDPLGGSRSICAVYAYSYRILDNGEFELHLLTPKSGKDYLVFLVDDADAEQIFNDIHAQVALATGVPAMYRLTNGVESLSKPTHFSDASWLLLNQNLRSWVADMAQQTLNAFVSYSIQN
jgi:hypothetical protein